VPLLFSNGLRIIEHHEDLTAKEIEYVDRYFMENVYPVLTPMAVDSSRPFPLIRNKSLNIGALVRKKEGDEELEFATVQVPSVLPRIVPIPSEKEGEKVIILLEELVERNIDKLFLNYNIVCAYPFRIMRNADLLIEEEEAGDLLIEIEKQLKKRQWGQAIRLEVEAGMDERLLKIIQDELHIMCVLFTEEVGGVITFVFEADGSLSIETETAEDDYMYDEISSGVLVNKIRNTRQELWESLDLYYRVFVKHEDISALLSEDDSDGEL